MNTQSIFANLGDAVIARRTTKYITDGVYLAEIHDVKQVESDNPQSAGLFMIFIDFLVLEVLVDKGTYTTPSGEEKSSAQAGEIITVCIKMSWLKAEEYLKAFLCAAGNITPAQASEISREQWTEFAEKSCFHVGDEVKGGFDTKEWTEQPLKGAKIKLSGTTKLTGKGKDFTVPSFSISD